MAARKRAARRTGIDPADISPEYAANEGLSGDEASSSLAVWNLEPTRCDRFIPTDHRHYDQTNFFFRRRNGYEFNVFINTPTKRCVCGCCYTETENDAFNAIIFFSRLYQTQRLMTYSKHIKKLIISTCLISGYNMDFH